VPVDSRPQTLTTIPETVATVPGGKSEYVTEALDGTTIVHKDEPLGTFGQSNPAPVIVTQPGNQAQVDWAGDEIDQHDGVDTEPRPALRV